MRQDFSKHQPLQVGQRSPNFKLLDQYGQEFELYRTLRRRCVVLFFYPKDYSPICSLEVIAFRQAYAQFVEAHAEVVGVSHDSQESHYNFCQSFQLPFRLLVDAEDEVKRKFGLSSTIDRYVGRVTFVIDQSATIRGIHQALFLAKPHMRSALATLKAIR